MKVIFCFLDYNLFLNFFHINAIFFFLREY